MANFTHKRTTTETMKIAGILNTASMMIEVDGEPKKLSTLLSVFDGFSIEVNIKIKDEEDLSEPTEVASDEDVLNG